MTDDLSILGSTVRHPVDHLETFPAPAGIGTVSFSCDEVASMCPVTEQPDLSTVTINYAPSDRCIESKSLKLYLWGFRDRGVFVESMATEIADRVEADTGARTIEVVVEQRVRGGIVTTARAFR